VNEDAPSRGIDDEFGKLIGLHEFYLDIGTKTAFGSFAIIGAIITYLSQSEVSTTAIRIALSLPFVLSLGNAIVFLAATRYAIEFKHQVEAVQRRLGVTWRPHVELIVGMTLVIGVLFAVVAIGLAVLLLKPIVMPHAGAP
jgi:hypothetical protein